MHVNAYRVSMLLAALVLGACAGTDPSPGTASSSDDGPSQRVYRTGSRFPVKEPPSTLTQQERDRQMDDARAAAQQQAISGARSAAGQ